MLKFSTRENMKPISRIFIVLMCLATSVAGAEPVATTLGSNLTAFNGNTGSTNNNQWNTLMNNRSGGVVNAPVADFGNCNAVIMRCAQPKCATGGCSSLEIARPIVRGCVNDSAACKKHGDDLVEAISAQIVANSNAKSQQAMIDAQNSAAQMAAQQSAQQMQQMQMQMQQMQTEMQQQNAQTVAQLQSALDEQKQLTADAIAKMNEQQQQIQETQTQVAGTELTDSQVQAAQQGVDADLLVREQIAGQILSKIENAEVAMKELDAVMQKTFDYAGCDSQGDNCQGPKRVKAFKEYAREFFDPYETVLDELYDALITAQAVGVNITDIYMMLNGSCNMWGQYLCSDDVKRYDETTCPAGVSKALGYVRGGHPCVEGGVVPPEDDARCTLHKSMGSEDEVYENWLWAEENGDSNIRVGCMSSILENSPLFRGRKQNSSISVDVLERIIQQDAPNVFGSSSRRGGGDTSPLEDGAVFCAVATSDMEQELQQLVSMKKLPAKICVSRSDLKQNFASRDPDMSDAIRACQGGAFPGTWSYDLNKCVCPNGATLYGNTCYNVGFWAKYIGPVYEDTNKATEYFLDKAGGGYKPVVLPEFVEVVEEEVEEEPLPPVTK